MTAFVAIDFETANYNRASACAIGLAKVQNGKIVAKEYSLIDPQDYFMDQFVDIHNISPEDVNGSPYFPEVWDEFKHHLDDVDFIVAHNAPFDKSVLYKCCESYEVEAPSHSFVCTVKAARQLWKGLPNHKLNTVCNHLDIELDHHEALSDAVACAKIAILASRAGYDFSK